MLKVSMKWNIRISYFWTKIEVCHLNNHSPKNEIKVVGTFRDIEVQSCPFGVLTLQNNERMGSNIWCRWRMQMQLIMKSIVLMHSCTPAYVITHSNRAFKFLQKRISHGKLWELIFRRLCTRFTWNFQWMLPLCLLVY